MNKTQPGKQCLHPIYCIGFLRDTIQQKIKEYNIYQDCKTFTDMPLKNEVQTVVNNFYKLERNYSKQVIEQFLSENFMPFQSDIQIENFTNWKPDPQIFHKISKFSNLYNLTEYVHEYWKKLLRSFNHNIYDGKDNQDRFTSIETPNPFIIAGERFGEYYYWDSFFIIQGLIVSELEQKALDIIDNFCSLVDRYGFVFNGGRIYYSDRSQPPLLTQMVLYVMNYFENKNMQQFSDQLLNKTYKCLLSEYNFWHQNRRLNDYSREQSIYQSGLNFYHSIRSLPRPESYIQDIELASYLNLTPANISEYNKQEQQLFNYIASGAESGMDFSSRWFEDNLNMGTIETPKIIPVDLNAILYKNEKTLMNFALRMKDNQNAQFFEEQAHNRLKQMLKFLFTCQDDDICGFFDYNLQKESLNLHFYSSNYVALWSFEENVINEDHLEKMIAKLKAMNDKYPGGIPTSEIESGQQWDFPNQWPPEIYLLSYGLLKQQNNKNAIELGRQIQCKYINNVLNAFEKYNYVYEKYNVTLSGSPGGGGEYTVQTGFGWSNGVLLDFINNLYPEYSC